MENNHEKFMSAKDEFLKLLPLVPILLSSISLFTTSLYYGKYDIDITQYLNPSEFITLNLLITITISTAFLLFAPIAYLLRRPIYGGMLKANKFTIWNQIPMFIFNGIVVYILNKIVPIASVIGFVRTQSAWSEFTTVLAVTTLLFIAVNTSMKLVIKINKMFPHPLNAVYLIYGLFFLIIFIFRLPLEIWYAYEAVDGKHSQFATGSFLKTDKETIPLDSNNYLIGRTNNYYFIRNTKEKSNLIVSSSEVKVSKFVVRVHK